MSSLAEVLRLISIGVVGSGDFSATATHQRGGDAHTALGLTRC
ncbi:hypothetical protein SAMN05216167_108191 [Spirosoma endophyticum]|uniref:Uncharacterized protein n=1 Tax=Spirosoma endophyticum TaxID=662367 RepID=A0A1I1W9F9_9BACT|nr:hypothetical protein SAMN05216167_108191 [Spirosoma endophyticum]